MQSIGKSLKSGYKICEPDFYENNTRDLDRLMLQTNFGRPEKADRGSFLHNYHRPYSKIFYKDMRYKVENVLEIGIWVGLGLLTWSHWFPNAIIEGVDWKFQYQSKIKRLYDLKEQVNNVERILLNWVDTSERGMVLKHFNPIKYDDYFDIIIDDGNHFSSGQKATLINFWQYLKPGGWYCIEDITDRYEQPTKIIEYLNELSEEGHSVGWFENPESIRQDSRMVAIKKKGEVANV